MKGLGVLPRTELARAPRAGVASSVGRKALVAVSGALLWGWCGLHMLGNLTAFAGPMVMDRYAAALRRFGSVPLWGMRVLLLAVFSMHVVLVTGLWRQARRGRPIGYAVVRYETATWASRSLRWGGTLLALFIVYHLLHLTVGALHPSFAPGRVYGNLVLAFHSAGVVIVYVLAAASLGLHLAHGLFSLPASLGLSLPARRVRRIALSIGVLLAVGFASVPLAVWFGVLT